jgi:chromosome segregation ATPase
MSIKKPKVIKIKKTALLHIDERGFGAILEDINDKFSVMIEGIGINTQQIERLENRFDNLENKVDKLENRFDNLENRFDNLENKVDKLDSKLSKRIDGLELKMETNFKIFFEYVSRIDEEIQEIKATLVDLKTNKSEVSDIAKMKIRILNLEQELAGIRRIVEQRGAGIKQ